MLSIPQNPSSIPLKPTVGLIHTFINSWLRSRTLEEAIRWPWGLEHLLLQPQDRSDHGASFDVECMLSSEVDSLT
jgi:hypothetical protein